MTDHAPVPATPGPGAVTGDRIATDLLRTALGRDHGLPGRAGLAVALRAALFAELALGGHLLDTGRAPESLGPPPAGDRILTVLHGAVGARSGVGWLRWFRHVEADLQALTGELVGSGRWTDSGTRRSPAYFDRDEGGAATLGRHARAVGLGQEAPDSPRDAVLGVLAVCVGGAHGPALPKDAVSLATLLPRFGDVDPDRLQGANAAVGHARVAQRKRRRRVV